MVLVDSHRDFRRLGGMDGVSLRGDDGMSWMGWAAIGFAIAIFVLDWIVVMGADPHKWKGGRKK